MSYLSEISKQDVQQANRQKYGVNVNDMLVKSKEELAHLDNLKETFTTLK